MKKVYTVLIVLSILFILFLVGSNLWTRHYIKKMASEPWKHPVELSGGVSLDCPIKMTRKEITLEEGKAQVFEHMISYEGGHFGTRIVVESWELYPGIPQDLNQAADIMAKLFRQTDTESTEYERLEISHSGVDGMEVKYKVNLYGSRIPMTAYYFFHNDVFYQVRMVTTLNSDETNAIWQKLRDGFKFPDKPDAIAPNPIGSDASNSSVGITKEQTAPRVAKPKPTAAPELPRGMTRDTSPTQNPKPTQRRQESK